MTEDAGRNDLLLALIGARLALPPRAGRYDYWPDLLIVNEPEHKLPANEQAQAFARVITAIIFGLGFAAAYWTWPSGITDLPLGSVTIGQLLWALASGAIVLITIGIAGALWAD